MPTIYGTCLLIHLKLVRYPQPDIQDRPHPLILFEIVLVLSTHALVLHEVYFLWISIQRNVCLLDNKGKKKKEEEEKEEEEKKEEEENKKKI